MRGDAPVKDDTAVTDADIASSNLILWGDPKSNKVLARIIDKLPVQWSSDSVALGTRKFAAATNAPGDDLPESAESEKVRGDQQRQYISRIRASRHNSLQVAYLPDYAVVDLTTPPDARWPGKIAAAGFFGEEWQLQPNDGR